MKRIAPLTALISFLVLAAGCNWPARAQVHDAGNEPSLPRCTLAAKPAAILVGEKFSLSWTSSGATSAAIKDGSRTVVDSPSLPAASVTMNEPVRSSDVALAAGTYAYDMRVTNQQGSSDCSATVTVSWRRLPAVPTVQRSIGLAGYSDSALPRLPCTSVACGDARGSSLGGRAFFWGVNYPTRAVLTSTYYPYDRDPDTAAHGREWYEQRHPDWLVYKADQRTLADLLAYPNRPLLAPIDITNPAVREHVLTEHWMPKLSRGFQSVSLDNVTTYNAGKRRYVRSGSGWKEIFPPSGSPSGDPAWMRAVGDWLDWSRTQLHARGALLAANLDWGYQISQPDFLALASRTDIAVIEKGAWNPGTTSVVGSQESEYSACIAGAPLPYDLDKAWEIKFGTLRQIANARGLVLIGECMHEKNISPSLLQWAIANYLLIRESRTLLLMTGLSQGESGRPFDRPELHVDIGTPVEAPHEAGGLWIRRYESGIAIVNPSGSSSRRLSLGTDRYRDTAGRLYDGVIEVPARSGITLLRDCERCTGRQ